MSTGILPLGLSLSCLPCVVPEHRVLEGAQGLKEAPCRSESLLARETSKLDCEVS